MAGNNPFRVYFGPNDLQEAPASTSTETEGVKITLAELLNTVEDAERNDRVWVHDFRDEKVTISADLYEVMLAYRHYRRESA